MLFNSPFYIFVFLPLVVVVYYLLQNRALHRLAKAWLVVASLYFYAYWNPAYLPLIVTSILVNYGLGSALHAARPNGQYRGIPRKAILTLGIVFNLGLLCYFKYTDFFIDNINMALGSTFPLLELILPLAISFFTFQQIAYLADNYQYDTHAYNLLDYALFVTFFPQLIAGPIVHHREMMPQFQQPGSRSVHWDNMARGLLIFCIGLLKKIAIADTFALWANAGFEQPGGQGLFEAWGTSLSYTFQLYYDFSGYSDMAIGAALMFNIRLPVNFNSPYKARDIRDFWRRWHMTLSRWLRDYLYIPLGGNRVGSARLYTNLMLTFILGGLWHGAAWTFVLWGALHGLALCTHRLWQRLGFTLPDALALLLTFVFVNAAWVFFRAEDIGSARLLLEGMLGFNGLGLDGQSMQEQGPEGTIHSLWTAAFIVVFGLVAILARNSLEIGLNKKRYNLVDLLLVISALSLAIALNISSSASEFLYFNF